MGVFRRIEGKKSIGGRGKTGNDVDMRKNAEAVSPAALGFGKGSFLVSCMAGILLLQYTMMCI